MSTQMNRFWSLFNKLYEVILTNTLFLLMNCCLFQLFFFVDFQPAYFLLYALASSPLIPSMMVLRRVLTAVHKGKEGSFGTAFVHFLTQSLKEEWRIWVLTPPVVFLVITNLYVLVAQTLLSAVLYVGNLILLGLLLLFLVNMIRLAPAAKGTDLLRLSVLTFFKNSLANCFTGILSIVLIFAAMKASFMCIIIIFGFIIKLSCLLEETGKVRTYHGISKK